MVEFFIGSSVIYGLYALLDAFSPEGLGPWLFWALTALCVLGLLQAAVSDVGNDDAFPSAMMAVFLFGLIWNKPYWSAIGFDGETVASIVVIGTPLGIAVMQFFKGYDRLDGRETSIAIVSGLLGMVVSANILRLIIKLNWQPFIPLKEMTTFNLFGVGVNSPRQLKVVTLALLALWDTLWLLPGVLAVSAVGWVILRVTRRSRTAF